MNAFKNMLLVAALFAGFSVSANGTEVAAVVVEKAAEVAATGAETVVKAVTTPVVSASTEVVEKAACESCVISNAFSGAAKYIFENPIKTVGAAVVLGAIIYFATAQDDADADNI